MTTFDNLRRQSTILAKDMSTLCGITEAVAHNVLMYAKCLTRQSSPGHIDELIFSAQMGFRFGINSTVHVKLMFEALRLKDYALIRLEDYVRLICTFMSPKLDLKINYVFSVYDTHKTRYLDRRGISLLLKPSIISATDDHDPEDSLKELVELVMSIFDNNNDGEIALEEFRQCVKDNILYIQLLGNVLPTDEDLDKFMNKMKFRSPNEIRTYFEDERATSLNTPHRKRETIYKSLYPVALDIP